MKKFLSLLLTLCSIQVSLAQLQLVLPEWSFPPQIPKVPTFAPYVGGDTARFAYLRETDAGQYLYLARMDRAHPAPKATSLGLLMNVDGVSDTIFDIIASPDNRYLAVYSFQDFGVGFVDHNFTFYSMVDGTFIEFRNEHSFSIFNESVATSNRLAEYKLALMTEFDIPAEELEEYDYSVEVEGANINTPGYGWNEDGSFRLAFELDVIAHNGGFSEGVIGSETFTININILDAGSSNLDFVPDKPAATIPLTFPLSLEARTKHMQFRSEDISFRQFFWWKGNILSSQAANIIEGNIPLRYDVIFP